MHLPAFLPLWLQILFFGCGAALIVLPGRIFAGGPSRISARIMEASFAAVIPFAAFVVFRASPALLGDGWLRGREVPADIIRPLEFLSAWLACRTYELGRPLFGIDGPGAVAIVSIFAGCLFLFFIWYYPRRIWEHSRDRGAARIFLIVSGVVALFFGYVESYALPCALIVGALLAAEANRRGKCPFSVVVLLLVAAAASHFMAVILFPALLALALSGHRRCVGRIVVVGTLGVVALLWAYLVLFASTYAQEAAAASMVLPLFSQPPLDYGLLSPEHVLDLANLLLLVCPGVAIAAPLLCASHNRKQKAGGRAFWILAIGGALCLPVLLDPKLGMARDWDLFGLGLAPLIVWAAVRLADLQARIPSGALVHPLFAQVTVLTMFVGINTHSPAAVARFENLLELDRNRGGYGHEILANWYREQGQTEKEIHHRQQAASRENNKRYWGGLALTYLQNGKYEDALEAAQRAYAIDPSWAKGIFYLASAYRELGMIDSALVSYDRSLVLDPNAHGVRHDLATLLMGLGRYDHALKQIDIAIGLAPDSAIYRGIRGWILLEADSLSGAERHLREALRMQPDLLSARVNLCRVFQQTGRADSALIEIGRIQQQPEVPPQIRNYLEGLKQLIRENEVPPDSAGP